MYCKILHLCMLVTISHISFCSYTQYPHPLPSKTSPKNCKLQNLDLTNLRAQIVANQLFPQNIEIFPTQDEVLLILRKKLGSFPAYTKVAVYGQRYVKSNRDRFNWTAIISSEL